MEVPAGPILAAELTDNDVADVSILSVSSYSAGSTAPKGSGVDKTQVGQSAATMNAVVSARRDSLCI